MKIFLLALHAFLFLHIDCSFGTDMMVFAEIVVAVATFRSLLTQLLLCTSSYLQKVYANSKYRVFQVFESPSSLNLCHCKQLRFPDYGLFNSIFLRD